MRKHNPHRREPERKPRKPLFFGWTNTKWFITEVGNMYSEKPSHFSKKRIESGVAFIIGQAGMILFLLEKYQGLSMTDFIMWASLEFAVGGYITYQIQRQKKTYLEYGQDYESGNGNGYYQESDQEGFHQEPGGHTTDQDGQYRQTNEPL